MAQFHFNLEGVLAHRQRVEDDCQRALAVIQARMRAAENELREVDQAIRASTEDVRKNRLVGRVDLGFLAAHRRYVAAMTRKGTQMAQKMALIQREVDAAQRTLAEAAKARKIIEKLREKQFDRWRSEQERKEAAALDEVVMRMAADQIMADESVLNQAASEQALVDQIAMERFAADQLQTETGVVP